jgi:hypothetical protein
MAPAQAEVRAAQQLADAYPAVPMRIITSVLTAYRSVTSTLPDAVRAAVQRLDDACAPPMTSSIGSHEEPQLTSVAIYLTQQDVDLIAGGMPVDLEAPNDKGGTLLVHILRERRHAVRRPADGREAGQVFAG